MKEPSILHIRLVQAWAIFQVLGRGIESAINRIIPPRMYRMTRQQVAEDLGDLEERTKR